MLSPCCPSRSSLAGGVRVRGGIRLAGSDHGRGGGRLAGGNSAAPPAAVAAADVSAQRSCRGRRANCGLPPSSPAIDATTPLATPASDGATAISRRGRGAAVRSLGRGGPRAWTPPRCPADHNGEALLIAVPGAAVCRRLRARRATCRRAQQSSARSAGPRRPRPRPRMRGATGGRERFAEDCWRVALRTALTCRRRASLAARLPAVAKGRHRREGRPGARPGKLRPRPFVAGDRRDDSVGDPGVGRRRLDVAVAVAASGARAHGPLTPRRPAWDGRAPSGFRARDAADLSRPSPPLGRRRDRGLRRHRAPGRRRRRRSSRSVLCAPRTAKNRVRPIARSSFPPFWLGTAYI